MVEGLEVIKIVVGAIKATVEATKIVVGAIKATVEATKIVVGANRSVVVELNRMRIHLEDNHIVHKVTIVEVVPVITIHKLRIHLHLPQEKLLGRRNAKSCTMLENWVTKEIKSVDIQHFYYDVYHQYLELEFKN